MGTTVDLVVAIFGAVMVWTSSIIGGIIWLSAKFRGLEKTIYREMDKLRRESNTRFYSHDTRIQRLEIKTFGFTKGNGADTPDDGKTFP